MPNDNNNDNISRSFLTRLERKQLSHDEQINEANELTEAVEAILKPDHLIGFLYILEALRVIGNRVIVQADEDGISIKAIQETEEAEEVGNNVIKSWDNSLETFFPFEYDPEIAKTPIKFHQYLVDTTATLKHAILSLCWYWEE